MQKIIILGILVVATVFTRLLPTKYKYIPAKMVAILIFSFIAFIIVGLTESKISNIVIGNDIYNNEIQKTELYETNRQLGNYTVVCDSTDSIGINHWKKETWYAEQLMNIETKKLVTNQNKRYKNIKLEKVDNLVLVTAEEIREEKNHQTVDYLLFDGNTKIIEKTYTYSDSLYQYANFKSRKFVEVRTYSYKNKGNEKSDFYRTDNGQEPNAIQKYFLTPPNGLKSIISLVIILALGIIMEKLFEKFIKNRARKRDQKELNNQEEI